MNLQYHIHESSIKCPYCDHDCQDDDYVVDQDKTEFECDKCEKVFWAEMNYVYSTYSDCSLNEIEHEWQQSKTHKMVYNCKNCSQYDVRELEGAK